MISEFLREAIKGTGKPLSQVARESGVAQPILSRFMSRKRSINLETAEKLFTYLGLEVKRRFSTIEEALQECRKWRLTDAEVEEMLR